MSSISTYRARHNAMSQSQCANAHISPLAILMPANADLSQVDQFAVQISYCDHHNVDFQELWRGASEEEAQRVVESYELVTGA